MKIHVQSDLTGGQFVAAIDPARTADDDSPLLDAPLPAGSLVLRDLGYFDLDRFTRFNAAGVFWISRATVNLVCTIDGRRHKLVDWPAAQQGHTIDRPILLSDRGVPCRLVACRVPTAVADKRREAAIRKSRKKYGCVPNRRQLAACEWTMYVTSLPAARLDAAAVHTPYRVRWQVELLFKLWKSHAYLGEHRSDDPIRQLIELLARLLLIRR